MSLERTFVDLAVAFGLGLLIGLQRERSSSELAGFRTFPLVAIAGVLSGILAQELGAWALAAGLIALAALIFGANQIRAQGHHADPGMTTEVALLVVFLLGAYLVGGHRAVAVVVGATTAVLLHFKPELHGFAKRLGDQDFKVMMQFVLISMVVLPVLPDQPFGPYGVLNPRKIWILVVLIVGLSLAGYVIYKLVGERSGSLVAGLLGGLISSTATTVSYARRDRESSSSGSSRLSAAVIVLASAVLYGRVIAVLTVVVPQHVSAVIGPIALMLTIAVIVAAVLWLKSATDAKPMESPAHTNPSELKSALLFALLFAGVLLASAAAKDHLGNRGLFLVAAASGLTDVDAITLSTARMLNAGEVEASSLWRVIIVASMANLLFKAGAVFFIGGPLLRRLVLLSFGVLFVASAAVLIAYPG